MFGGMKGISAIDYRARVNALSAGGGHGGRSVPSLPGRGKPTSTKPLCLCDLQRKADKGRK